MSESQKSGVPYHEVGAEKRRVRLLLDPPFYIGGSMNFSFYKVNTAYCDHLRKFDPCVPYTMDQKSIRPFVGIVLKVGAVSISII